MNKIKKKGNNTFLKVECGITGIRSKNRKDVPAGFVEVEVYECNGERKG